MTDYMKNVVDELRGKQKTYEITGNPNFARLFADAADAIEELQKVNRERTELYEDAVKQIPKRGEWKKKYDNHNWYYWYVCSECGNRPLKDGEGFYEFSSYCPSCGAKMGVQDGKEN